MSSNETNPRHVRPDMVTSAVSFLSDPKVQSSSISQRVNFLENKGLSPDEIDEALRQTGTSGAITAGAAANAGPSHAVYPQPHQQPMYYGAPPQYGYPQSRQQYDRDWRDWFIMAVVSGTVGYGIISLARKYLFPHLQPPNQTVLEEDRDALTAKYDEVAAQLAALDAETKGVKAGIEEQKVSIERGIKEVEDAVKAMRENDKRRNDDMENIKAEVDSMKEQLPKMFEKTKEAQSASLSDLQNELKSLKSLLSSRGSGVGSRPYGAGSAGGSGSPGIGTGTPNDQGRSSPSFGNSKPSIPAWQLAPGTAGMGASNGVSPGEGSPKAASVENADVPNGTSTVQAGVEHAKESSEGYSVAPSS